MKLSQNKKLVKFLGGILALFFVWQIISAENGSGFLEAHFFDVGQGDAIFIEGPEDLQVLVDGGPGSKILEKLGQEMNYFDRYIDVVVATHPDKDHINGLIDVLKYYDVGEVWMTDIGKETSVYEEFLHALQEHETEIKIVKRGDEFHFENFGVLVLNPSANYPKKEKTNNHSIVLKIIYDNISFLLTGDIEKPIEKDLINHYRGSTSIVRADVLKVAHHGSKSSSSEEFLKIVAPEIAIIQVGEGNPYHHPHNNIVEQFDDLGIPVLRNDIDGDVTIISDGNYYAID